MSEIEDNIVAQQTLDAVNKTFMGNPHLVVQILDFMGARDIRVTGNIIRSTCPLHKGDNKEAFAVVFGQFTVKWYCYTHCHAQGGMAKLVMKKYHVDFKAALGWLAHWCGVPYDPTKFVFDANHKAETDLDRFKRTWGIDGVEQDRPNIFPEQMVNFARQQWMMPEAQEARLVMTGGNMAAGQKYFSPDVLNYWEVGFVPGGTWTYQDPQTKKPRGWFESRICIPIRAIDGTCIGFSGRQIRDTGGPKYLTFPGTKKHHAWYGLNLQSTKNAIASSGTVVVEEGYGDVWRSHQFGMFNATCAGGTEFHQNLFDILDRLNVPNIVFYMDGDSAGAIAAEKAARRLPHKYIWIASPPDGKDPGDILDAAAIWHPIKTAKRFYSPRR